MKLRKYYTLLEKDTDPKSDHHWNYPTPKWVIVFGDYDLDVVKQEKSDLKESSVCKFMIIVTSELQEDIFAELRRINSIGKSFNSIA
jgi:hypothetical protein